MLRRADGSGEAKVLVATPRPDFVSDWSRDGKYILYLDGDQETAGDIWYLERKEDGSGWEQRPFLQTPSVEHHARFSPNGRYVAYSSNESGQYEVYVRPFPEGGRKWTVSRRGGDQPRWSRDGKELFYVEGSALIAVSISNEPTFSLGSIARLFDHMSFTRSDYPQYDVSDDAQRFVIAEPTDTAEPSIHIVQSWYEEFRNRR
jgi:Tol biopolymer transport system component